ncbi:hypothetical protein GCM10007424_05340 [Flavobacterium suaedae]|uniref:Transglutaminase-like domain-containing protein n=1 Tax=Flavobacterium suaedae TaxID=1767027 RepID=A0ABQ1JIP2_9FLAO|nr:transglutaminase domain-containing protein [Flavobacterium suaedae]GGB68258.1 hypothetical protein GCM10007424_05340 [Flavobacterium suaedae]
MRKILLALLLLFTAAMHAQDTQKVWDLLLKNDREGARETFDKKFKKKKNSNIELLVLDAIIDEELGRIYYDETFLKDFAALDESEKYLYSIWYRKYGIGAPESEGYDDLAYKKMDYVASVDKFKSNPMVIYTKAVYDKRRYDLNSYKTGIEKLGAIEKWQFCGVFENMNGSGLDTEYEAEFYAKNDKTFNANSNGIVNWYNPAIVQREGYHFYSNEGEYGSGTIYAQTFIESDADREVVLNFGTSDPIKILINDVEVYRNDKALTTNLNAFSLKFNLPKGISRLVIKSAISGSSDYFYAAIKDKNGKAVNGLKFYDTYKPYTKSTAEQLKAEEINPDYEEFLIQKLKEKPGDIFHTYLLYSAYMSNNKKEKAYEVIESLYEKYPESSLLKVELIPYFELMGDEQKKEELEKSVLVKDEYYYYSIIKKIQDDSWMRSANISDIEEYRDKAKNLKSDLYSTLYDFLIVSRNQDVEEMMTKAETIVEKSYHNENLVISFSQLYTSLKNDKEKTISIYEELANRVENISAQNQLISYYNSVGRKDDVKKILLQRAEYYPYNNYIYEDLINIAYKESNYEEGIKYTTTALNNFPYSYGMMERKGNGYNYLKNTKEAEKYFRQSLVYNSADSSLRRTLYDITKTPDELEEVSTKDIYELIKNRRNSKLKNDYGVTLLLDEFIVNILPEGSRKAKTIYVYEVTAESGIEELKEYRISASGLNIIKAEIVKPDGTIVPGDRGYGTVVFTNLAVNDVVYIEYESTSSGYGRFYKDFNTTSFFNGSYPCVQTIFGIISPEDVTFSYEVVNGNVTPKKSKVNGRNYIRWELNNTPAMPIFDSYSPSYYNVANQIQISSIKTWGEIANWYADLVKKNVDMDNVALKTFNEIFPNEAKGLSDEEKAYKIYKYIEDNITYSSLDFRQSGYVPQKPSKTISTKLGDCKDVSTLFVAMAEKAGLDAKLVLVLTSDNGTVFPILPEIDFNHCIVKVMLNGKEHFLELTNKYLPFKALPLSLYNAKALVVSLDRNQNEKANIINIPFTNAMQNILSTTTVVDVKDDTKHYTNTVNVQGLSKSYYNELFSDATTADMRNKKFEEDINGKLDKAVSLESVKLIENSDKYSESMKFESKFSITEKLQSVGSLKITDVPYLDKVYTRDIITNEKRKYDIDYTRYENTNEYHTTVIVNIEEGKKFIEIPEGKELKFKGHNYKIKYELVSPNSLKVTRDVTTPWNTIKVADYDEYKKYVEEVLAIEEAIIGFK